MVEKSTSKIGRAASGKSPFQRQNQELLENTFGKSEETPTEAVY